MIFRYNIKIPLTYNKFEILSNNPESEIIYEIEEACEESFKVTFRTYEVPGCNNGFDFNDMVKIILHKPIMDNKTGKDDHLLVCEIDGILAGDEIYAKTISEKITDKICKRLSLVFIKHNSNRHLYHPRVEPVWSEAVFNRCEYDPFVEAKHKALERLDGNNKNVYLENHIYIHNSMYCTIRASIPSKEIKIIEWISNENDIIEFLMNEYYSALGTENIKSKFFHLFVIIEFCEKEFEEHNGANRLLSAEEVDVFIKEIKEKIDGEKREKIISVLKNDLMRANDIGRIEKLKNIFKWMGIDKYKQSGDCKNIDNNFLSDIIKLRNKSFHGTKENIYNLEKKYADAVEALLYIDEKIIDFSLELLSQRV